MKRVHLAALLTLLAVFLFSAVALAQKKGGGSIGGGAAEPSLFLALAAGLLPVGWLLRGHLRP